MSDWETSKARLREARSIGEQDDDLSVYVWVADISAALERVEELERGKAVDPTTILFLNRDGSEAGRIVNLAPPAQSYCGENARLNRELLEAHGRLAAAMQSVERSTELRSKAECERDEVRAEVTRLREAGGTTRLLRAEVERLQEAHDHQLEVAGTMLREAERLRDEVERLEGLILDWEKSGWRSVELAAEARRIRGAKGE